VAVPPQFVSEISPPRVQVERQVICPAFPKRKEGGRRVTVSYFPFLFHPSPHLHALLDLSCWYLLRRGPREGGGVESGARSWSGSDTFHPPTPPCEGVLLQNGDGTWENAYTWDGGFTSPPDYGAFVEGYTGAGAVCGIRLYLTQTRAVPGTDSTPTSIPRTVRIQMRCSRW